VFFDCPPSTESAFPVAVTAVLINLLLTQILPKYLRSREFLSQRAFCTWPSSYVDHSAVCHRSSQNFTENAVYALSFKVLAMNSSTVAIRPCFTFSTPATAKAERKVFRCWLARETVFVKTKMPMYFKVPYFHVCLLSACINNRAKTIRLFHTSVNSRPCKRHTNL